MQQRISTPHARISKISLKHSNHVKQLGADARRRVSVRVWPARRRLLATAEPVEREKAKEAPSAPPAPTTIPRPGSTPPSGPPSPPPPNKKRPFIAKVLDQALDTAEDIARHVNRAILPLPTRTALDKMVMGRRGRYRLQSDKPVVLVCGSGWGAHSIIKVIDTDNFEVVLVSPRNFFFFTPMLPSTAVGSVEFRSLTDPIRVANPFVSYLDAFVTNVDTKRKVALCRSDACLDDGKPMDFEVQYDALVMAIGEQPATFGVPGVKEHCFFLKEITDAVGLRSRIGENFEYAALPSTNPEERARALHFVVVGGGPTGVEFSGTLADYIRQDLRRKYPELMPIVRVTLLQSAQSILTMFDQDLQDRAIRQLQAQGVEVRLGVKVVEVTSSQVKLGNGTTLDYGVCVWSAGNAARPLTQQLVEAIPEQQELLTGVPKPLQKLQVDSFLRVIGAEDVIALGDCSAIVPGRLPATAQVAAQQGAYVAHLINRGYSIGTGGVDQPAPAKQETQRNMLQVLQDGMSGSLSGSIDLPERERRVKYYNKPFDFLDLGMMAYIGGDRAATQLNAFDTEAKLFGYGAYFVWRSVYITKQVSFRNRVLILFDWVKAQVFGRDVSLF